MAKERKRRRRSSYRASNRKHSYRARSRNPYFGKKSYRRRRRNPGGFGGTISELGGLILWGTGGAIASRALPQMVLGTSNTGVVGYFANLATAFLGGGLVGKFSGNRSAGARFTAGGVIGTGLRIFGDYFGKYSQQFGLSGDLDFDLGYYIPNSFPLPTTGSGPYLLNPGQTGLPMAAGGVPGTPIAAIQAPGATTLQTSPANGADEPARWGSRWAA